MASLKSTIVDGTLVVTDKIRIKALEAYSSATTTTSYTLGSSGYVLRSTGSGAYWQYVSDSASAGAISSSNTYLVTERDVYYGLPTINGGHSYNSSTNYYVANSIGTQGQVLTWPTSGNTPIWASIGPSLPAGGAVGDALVKNSTNDGDATWKTVASTNTASAIVARDSSGNFAAGTITAGYLIVNAQDTTYEGGEIQLAPATAALTTAYIDNCNNLIRMHNGSTTWFDVNLTTGVSEFTGPQLYVGSTTATSETDIVLYGGSGSFALFSHVSDGGHGLWAYAHGTDTAGKSVFYLDTNNAVSYASGTVTGNWVVNDGYLYVTANSNTVTIGSQNGSYCHFSNSVNIPFYFNKSIYVDGQIIQYVNAVVSQSWYNGRDSAAVRVANYNYYHAGLSMKTTSGSWEIGVYTDDKMWFTYVPDSNYNSNTNTVYQFCATSNGRIQGAVWNDIAEYRQSTISTPGRCVQEHDNGILSLTQQRLIPGSSIISDTFGFAEGETKDANTPVAITGRVLAYTYQDKSKYHAGMAVCSAPNGTIDIMTREEIIQYPDSIIGIVSEIPDYETWGTDNINVDGRIWIKVR